MLSEFRNVKGQPILPQDKFTINITKKKQASFYIYGMSQCQATQDMRWTGKKTIFISEKCESEHCTMTGSTPPWFGDL
jgi:hypothetical protein